MTARTSGIAHFVGATALMAGLVFGAMFTAYSCTRSAFAEQADTGPADAGVAVVAPVAATDPAPAAGSATEVPPIADPLTELGALKAKYDALKAAKDSGNKDLIWFAYALLGAGVLRVLLAGLTAWRGDKPKGWAKWAALGAAVPLALLTYYGAGAGLWAAIVMAGAGPGAVVANELVKSFGKKTA